MRFAIKHAAVAAACMAAFPAYATNGYFLPGFGIRSEGMGGVGIAYGRDSLSTAANPANAVNTGMRGDMGFAVFNPERYGSNADTVTTDFFDYSSESDAKYFIMPEMGFSMPLTDKVHVSLAVVGNGGMNTTYPTNLFSFFGNPPVDQKLGVDMMQVLVPISAAYKVNENHAFGASLVLAETRFRAYGLDAFKAFPILSDPSKLTGNGFDYSYGAGVKLGWLGEFMDDRLTVGLTYASRTYMTEFDKYASLFAEQGDFDIPENYGIGIAFKPVKNLVIAADVLRINFSEIASVGNPGPGTDPDGIGPLSGIPALDFGVPCPDPSNPYCTGRDQGMGFGWEDQTVYKLGVQYGVNNRLLLRAGYNYGKSPIPDDQMTFTLLVPATVEEHYSVGFTYKANQNLEVTGTYMYAASHSQSACDQNIVGCTSFNMHQNVFGLTLGWVLDPGPGALDEYGEGDWAGINFDGWYAGLGVGQSNYRGFDADSANTRSEGWKVYAGYAFNKYLAVEGGYANLNDMTARTGALTTNVATDAWTLGAVLSYPVAGKLSVMAKLGAAYMLSDIKVRDGVLEPLPFGPDTVRSGDDDFEPNYGAGVSYALFDNLNLRAEWERFERDELDIDLVTAGAVLEF